MKTTIDIPDDLLSDVLHTSGEKTKRGAILAAMIDYRRRAKMGLLVKHLGTFDTLVNVRDAENLQPAKRSKATKSVRSRRAR